MRLSNKNITPTHSIQGSLLFNKQQNELCGWLALLLFTLFILICLFNSGYALANDNLTKTPEIIEVYGSLQPQSLNTETIHRNDFSATATTLTDLLSSINGLQIRQVSGLGNPVEISLRGSTSKQVNLYIDGQLINDSQWGSFDLNQVPIEHIESIEISKSHSGNTGVTPIGGEIRIYTYNPSQNSSKLTSSVGSFGYKSINILQSTAFNKHQLSAGLQSLTTDNDYPYLVPQSFNNSQQTKVEPLKNNQFKKLAIHINDEILIDQHLWRFSAQHSKQDKGIANYLNNSPENSRQYKTRINRLGLQYQWSGTVSWLEHLDLEGYVLDKNELYLDTPYPSQLGHYDYDSQQSYLSVQPNIRLGAFTLLPYINYQQQQFQSQSINNGQPLPCNGISACDVKAEQQQTQLGAKLEWVNKKQQLNAYVLFNNLNQDNQSTTLPADPKQRERITNTLTASTHELGLTKSYKHYQFGFAFSKGSRFPTLFELFGDRGTFKGNQSLQPEQATTYSLNSQYNHEDLQVTAAIYQQQLTNSIVAIFNTNGVGSYTNISDAKLLGIESEFRYQLTNNLNIKAQVHVIDTTTSSVYRAFNNKNLPSIYHQQYALSAHYAITSQWRMSLSHNRDQDLYFNRANLFASQNHLGNGNPADRQTTDISLNWKGAVTALSFSIKNIFDQQYQDLANRPAQGRSFQLKLTLLEI